MNLFNTPCKHIDRACVDGFGTLKCKHCPKRKGDDSMFPLEAILSAFPTEETIRVWDSLGIQLCVANCVCMIPYSYRSSMVTSVTKSNDGFIDVVLQA